MEDKIEAKSHPHNSNPNPNPPYSHPNLKMKYMQIESFVYKKNFIFPWKVAVIRQLQIELAKPHTCCTNYISIYFLGTRWPQL